MNSDKQVLISECKSTIKNTKKWLKANKDIGNPENAANKQLRIYEIALAALTADPVAYTEKHEISNMEATGLYLRAWPTDRRQNEKEGYDIPLFTTPPAPSAPEVAYDLAKPGTEATVITYYQAPHGWRLVPILPTQAMVDAHTEGMVSGGAMKAYREMLAAAPAPGGE